MAKARLIKKVEGIELWESRTPLAQQYAVRTTDRRARVFECLETAEAAFSEKLGAMREARAH